MHACRSTLEDPTTLAPLTSARDNVAWLAVFDERGDVAWLYDGGGIRFLETVLLPGGRLLTLHDTEILEIDWLGRVHGLLTDDPGHPTGTLMEVGGLNHELAVDDAGSLVTLSEVGTPVRDYPLSYDTPDARGDAVIAEDRAVVLDPETGRTLASLSFLDVFDRARLGYDSLNTLGPGLDWTHSNAATPIGDDFLLSARNQDAVARVGRDGVTRWILGNHANWGDAYTPLLLEPVGEPFAWMYHQHAPKYDDGRVLLFDNGNHRASPWTGEPQVGAADAHSRVVQYTVDEDAMTVRQDWSFELDPVVFSGAMGDADWLPNGNVLATFAFVHWEGGLNNADIGRGAPSVRLVELDPATGAVVWDLDVWAPADAVAPGWQSYRAERFAAFDLTGLVGAP